MNTETARGHPLSIIALGWGISAALIVLFIVCLVASFVLPDLPASQGWSAWISLFSVTPTAHPFLSVRVWFDGIAFSLVFGWVTAVVVGLVYNRIAGH